MYVSVKMHACVRIRGYIKLYAHLRAQRQGKEVRVARLMEGKREPPPYSDDTPRYFTSAAIFRADVSPHKSVPGCSLLSPSTFFAPRPAILC